MDRRDTFNLFVLDPYLPHQEWRLSVQISPINRMKHKQKHCYANRDYLLAYQFNGIPVCKSNSMSIIDAWVWWKLFILIIVILQEALQQTILSMSLHFLEIICIVESVLSTYCLMTRDSNPREHPHTISLDLWNRVYVTHSAGVLRFYMLFSPSFPVGTQGDGDLFCVGLLLVKYEIKSARFSFRTLPLWIFITNIAPAIDFPQMEK